MRTVSITVEMGKYDGQSSELSQVEMVQAEAMLQCHHHLDAATIHKFCARVVDLYGNADPKNHTYQVCENSHIQAIRGAMATFAVARLVSS